MKENPALRLAILISGGGTTLQNLIDEITVGHLHASIELVIASAPNLGGSTRANAANLPLAVANRRSFPDTVQFSEHVFSLIDRANVDLICLAGWLCLLQIPEKYAGKIMNIHPALLPSFGGKGMYGKKVHQAVLDHGCKITGCTVHFVDQHYDNGPIILQRTCPVLETDTAESLAHRVFDEEKIAYPQAIELFRQNRLKFAGRRVQILP